MTAWKCSSLLYSTVNRTIEQWRLWYYAAMKNAIILHGTTDKDEYYSDKYPSMSNSHWLPWLQKQLLMKDIAAVTPDMVKAYQPDYQQWKIELERYDITPETVLVGHSCGAGFLVRWLSEAKDVRVGKVVLVAPWLDPHNVKQSDFFNFEIDATLVARTGGVVIYNSDDDFEDIQVSVRTLTAAIDGVKVREFSGYGHFCIGDMGTIAFPELLTEVLA